MPEGTAPTMADMRERIGVYPTYGSRTEWQADFDRALAKYTDQVREQALREAGVVPEFAQWLPHDEEYEYTSTGDCDGKHVRYLRRRPRLIGEPGTWETATKAAFEAAAVLIREQEQTGA